eukprot:Hpha_TRINITY_DN14384_c0_g1::TRINITY_DN14384_c0_g1_i2::g.86698::m.86698
MAAAKRSGWFPATRDSVRPFSASASGQRRHNSTIIAHGAGAGGTGAANGEDAALFVAAHSIDRKRGTSAPAVRSARVPESGPAAAQVWQRAVGRFTAAAAARASGPGVTSSLLELPRRLSTGSVAARAGSLGNPRGARPADGDGPQSTLSRADTAPVRRMNGSSQAALAPPLQAESNKRASELAPPASPIRTQPVPSSPSSAPVQASAESYQSWPPANGNAGGAGSDGKATGEGAPSEPSSARDGPASKWTYPEGGSGSGGGGEDRVLIHVFDEVNNASRDFIAKRDALLREMKYFRSHLTGDCALDDLDISVHCDIHIFRWLMEYIHSPPQSRPKIETTIAVSILISSEFLEMTDLVTETIAFVAANVQEIIKLPIDLECINRGLLSRIAGHFRDVDLDLIRDRKDKIVGALFLHKLERLLSDTRGGCGDAGEVSGGDGDEECGGQRDVGRNVLLRCALCGKLYTAAQSSWSVCTKSAPHITFHGNAVSEHCPDHHWDVNAYLAKLRCRRLSWREIYWRVWALVNYDYCRSCGRHFTYAELGHCAYHVALPSFSQGSSVGVYSCCGAEVRRFESGAAAPSGLGCCARYHATTAAAEGEKGLLGVVQRHPGILIPWTPQRGRGEPLAADMEGITQNRNSDFIPPQEGVCAAESDSGSSSSTDETFGTDWRRRSRLGRQNIPRDPGDDLRRLFHSFPAAAQQNSSQEKASTRAVSEGENVSRGRSSSVSRQPPISSASGETGGGTRDRKRRKQKKGGAAGGDRGPARAPSHVPGREGTGPSVDWWARLGPKGRAAYFLDSQREDDARRFAALSQSLDKRRKDRVDDKFERNTRGTPASTAKAGPRKGVGERPSRPSTARPRGAPPRTHSSSTV